MAMPFADVSFQNNPKRSQRQPSEVFIRQREYNHEIAVITMDYESPAQAKYRHGSPVAIKWGWLPSTAENFFGYVNYTKTVDGNDKTRKLKVYCTGASYPMNQARQRSYQKLYVGGIISRIARLHHLSLLQDPSSRYHRHIPQLGQSDFTLAVRLAKDIGFTFLPRGTTLYFKRRQIDNRPGRQPLFRLTRGVYQQRGAIYNIEHQAGSAPFAERSVVQIDGLDDQGNIVTTIDTGDCCDPVKPVFTKFTPPAEAPESIRSIQEGKELLSGLSGTNRFYVIANADLSGDPRVRPGMTVAFADIGADVDGYWWVGSVDHTITTDSYTMKTQVGRETIKSTTYVPAPTSDSGKPEIIMEPGVELIYEPDPASVYDPLDDCVPIEDIITDPFGDNQSMIPDPFESDARRQMRERRPRPVVERGCCPDDGTMPVPVPRLHGWKSFVGSYRTTS